MLYLVTLRHRRWRRLQVVAVPAAGDSLPSLQPAQERTRTVPHQPEQLLPQLPEEGQCHHIYIVEQRLCVCLRVCVCMCVHACVCMRACMHACVCGPTTLVSLHVSS